MVLASPRSCLVGLGLTTTIPGYFQCPYQMRLQWAGQTRLASWGAGRGGTLQAWHSGTIRSIHTAVVQMICSAASAASAARCKLLCTHTDCRAICRGQGLARREVLRIPYQGGGKLRGPACRPEGCSDLQQLPPHVRNNGRRTRDFCFENPHPRRPTASCLSPRWRRHGREMSSPCWRRGAARPASLQVTCARPESAIYSFVEH